MIIQCPTINYTDNLKMLLFLRDLRLKDFYVKRYVTNNNSRLKAMKTFTKIHKS